MQDIEKQTVTEIKKYQEKELQKLLVYLEKNSPFYQKLFQKNNIDVREIKRIEDLMKIPATTKNDLQASNWAFLCVDKNKIVEYCTTSGTMGSPVTIALTEKDIERLAYNEYLSFTCAGTGANDIYQFMLTLDRQFMAGIAYYSGLRKLGGGIIRVGPGNTMMQIDTIQRLNSTVLIAVPSFIINVISHAKEKKIDLNGTSVRKIICIGENIRNEDFSLNTLGERIVNHWNVELYSTYASTEKQTAFTECKHGKGGHHRPDLLVFEVLDENNKQLPQGEYGELTITTLGVEGMPLLRYKTGDICAYHNEPCACGRTTARISPIKGRKQQMIKYNGTTLYPQAVFNLLNSITEIEDYVVRVFKNEIGTDEIQIHIAVKNLNTQADHRIKKIVQSTLRVSPDIKYVSLPEINQMQLQEGKRKVSRLLDSR